MSTPHPLFAQADARATAQALPYRGAVTPNEAQQLIEAGLARVVDVRSSPEWAFVGRVPDALELQWKTFPGMRLNTDFLSELKAHAKQDEALLFLCRTAGRSHEAAAAATAAGFTQCYNILEGFEGDKDAAGHRGHTSGWKARGLPWIQS